VNVPSESRAPTSGRGLLLACEGVDDEQFLIRMLAHLQIVDVAVRRYDGKPRLPQFLLGLRDSTEFETVQALGIFRDADASAQSAHQSVRDRLQRLMLPRPHRSGELITDTCEFDGIVRTVGIFIVPDGQSAGELEDLCLRAIAADPALDCARDFLECVRTHAGIACRQQDQSKAWLNSWLASRPNPSLRIGQAVATRDLRPDSRAFDDVKRFLTDLARAVTPL
jgi:hypothetical protein